MAGRAAGSDARGHAVVDALASTGHYSVLRWRNDATRDEARNVAVIVVSGDGRRAALRAAPISSISPRLHDQGILDALIAALERQFETIDRPGTKTIGRPGTELLTQMHNSLHHSLYLTEPAPTAVPDLDVTAAALYRAYVAPRSRGGREVTSGKLLDQVVKQLRRSGLSVHRGEYLSSFLFDAVIGTAPDVLSVLKVLSFATTAHNWTMAEYNAGHFLYAVKKLSIPSTATAAIIKPPAHHSHMNAQRAYANVTDWLKQEKVQVHDPNDVDQVFAEPVSQARLPLTFDRS